MLPTHRTRPRVFIDADILFAGSASPQHHSASQVILRMAEITLLEALTCEQVIVETDRNLQEKMPAALPAFRLLVSRSLQIVTNPTAVDILPYTGKADPKDLSILIAAFRENCTWLVTFNTRHYQPGLTGIMVVKPGDFIMRVRDLLLGLM